MGKRIWGAAVLAFLALAGGAVRAGAMDGREPAARLGPQYEIQVKFLYDNSGSMYPGYKTGVRNNRAKLGAEFFFRHRAFLEMLSQLAAAQTRVNASGISLWHFTDNKLEQLGDFPSPKVSPEELEEAFGFLPRPGQKTYLGRSLERAGRDFTGLVWLITDNVVDTRAGTPDNLDVRTFFQGLNDNRTFRAVHLFKFPLADPKTGILSNLAVYAVLVSLGPLEPEVVRFYDRKLEDMAGVFEGGERLKLKDLMINPVELEAEPMTVRVDDPESGQFQNDEIIICEIKGLIRSKLTHHHIVGGKYTLTLGDFQAEGEALDLIKAVRILPGFFPSCNQLLEQELPPLGKADFFLQVGSLKPLDLGLKGLEGYWKSAFGGVAVGYRGKAEVVFRNIEIRLERSRMAGIYGVDEASEVFDFQDYKIIPESRIEDLPLEFTVVAGSSPALVFAFLGLLAAALIALIFWLLLRRRHFEVILDGVSKTVSLRGLGGGYQATCLGQGLGNLRHWLAGWWGFTPFPDRPGFRVASAGGKGPWTFGLEDGNHTLDIRPKTAGPRQGKSRIRRPGTVAARPKAAPAPMEPRIMAEVRAPGAARSAGKAAIAKPAGGGGGKETRGGNGSRPERPGPPGQAKAAPPDNKPRAGIRKPGGR